MKYILNKPSSLYILYYTIHRLEKTAAEPPLFLMPCGRLLVGAWGTAFVASSEYCENDAGGTETPMLCN